MRGAHWPLQSAFDTEERNFSERVKMLPWIIYRNCHWCTGRRRWQDDANWTIRIGCQLNAPRPAACARRPFPKTVPPAVPMTMILTVAFWNWLPSLPERSPTMYSEPRWEAARPPPRPASVPHMPLHRCATAQPATLATWTSSMQRRRIQSWACPNLMWKFVS